MARSVASSVAFAVSASVSNPAGGLGIPDAMVVEGSGTVATRGLYLPSGDSYVMGDYTLEPFVDAMVVEDSGDPWFEGIYYRNGENDGKPRYIHEDDSLSGFGYKALQWDTSFDDAAWYVAEFSLSPSLNYISTEDVATPDLVENWTLGEFAGTAPAPTVRRATLADAGITAAYVTWRIVDSLGNVVYSNPTTSLTPPLTGWVVGTGTAPAPTVRRATILDFWILADATWDDSKKWVDSATWSDGI